jgi:hypothetical protein
MQLPAARREPRPPMVSVKLPKSVVSGFSSLESNEVAKFFQVKSRADCSL